MGFHAARLPAFILAVESLAYEYKMYFDIIRETIPGRMQALCAVRRGAKSALMNQISRCAGVPIRTLKIRIPRGLRVIAGYGVGLYDSIPKTVDRLTVFQDEFIPDPLGREAYQLYAAAYRKSLNICGPSTLFCRRLRHKSLDPTPAKSG